MCWKRGYKVTALCFSPKFQTDLWGHEQITCILSPKAFVLGDALGKGALGTDCPASLSVLPGLSQCFNLHFPVFFSTSRYICIYTHTLRILSTTPSKWCKTSPLLCDFHSLLPRLEEHAGAIPYVTAQYHLSPSASPLLYFHWLDPARDLAQGRIFSLFLQLNGSCHNGLQMYCLFMERMMWYQLSSGTLIQDTISWAQPYPDAITW